MVGDMGLKLLYRVHLNGIISLANIMKIYQTVQKLLLGDTDRHTYTYTHRPGL
jgi:hypothetical protein